MRSRLIDQPGTNPDQTGSIGFAPNPAWYPGDSYTTADNVLTLGKASYSYCISGTGLRLTPVSTDLTGTVEGSVELEMQSSAQSRSGQRGIRDAHIDKVAGKKPLPNILAGESRAPPPLPGSAEAAPLACKVLVEPP